MKYQQLLELLVQEAEVAKAHLEICIRRKSVETFAAAALSCGKAAGIYKVFLDATRKPAPKEIANMMIGLEETWRFITGQRGT